MSDRDAMAIIQELLSVTEEMVARLKDPDYLVECVEKRQALMNEYDAYSREHPGQIDKYALKPVVSKIIAMDEKINASLVHHKKESRRLLSETQAKQKALEYKMNKVSATGSYLNQAK